MYYTPWELMYLQANRNNPDILANLRQSYSKVKPVDDAAIESRANAKKQQYVTGTVAPELARLIAGAGGEANSFAAARQAALAQQGSAQADSVYQQEKQAAQSDAYAMHNQQLAEEDRAWSNFNDDYMGGGYGGGGQGYGRQAAMMAADAQDKADRTDRYIEGGAQALNWLGSQYSQAKQQGYNPFAKLAQSIGSVARDFVSAPSAIKNGFQSGFSNSPLGRNASGSNAFTAMVPGANGYGGYDTRRF